MNAGASDDVALACSSAGAFEHSTPVRGSDHTKPKAVLLQEMLMAVLPCTHEASNASPNLFGYAADSAKSCKLPVHMPSGVVAPQFAMCLLALASFIQGLDSWPSGQPLVDLLQLWLWAVVVRAPAD